MLSFKEWLEESVRHHFLWGDDIAATDQRDNLGIPLLSRPGFRPKDKKFIQQQSDQATQWLNSVTNKYGINWEIIYLEPNENETNSPEGFESYKKRSTEIAKEKITELMSSFQPSHPEQKPPNPNNTIVYVKPTSRVHPLSSHQQVHNIAHAIWGYAKKHRSLFVSALNRIIQTIRKRIMYDLRNLPMNRLENYANTMPKHDKFFNNIENVTEEEIIVIISRLLNLKSMKRIFDMTPEDFNDPKKAANQVYGSWDEFLYEMVAAFFRAGGKINLRPQSGLKEKLTPAPGIQQHPNIKSPKAWAWNELFDDQNFWDNVSDQLTSIVVSALEECTFAKLGRPIYATYGGLPQT